MHLHAFDFVNLLIFIGPPDACTDSIADGIDPVSAGEIFADTDASESSSFKRRPGVIEVNGLDRVSLELCREVYKDCAQLTRVFELALTVHDPVDIQVGK